MPRGVAGPGQELFPGMPELPIPALPPINPHLVGPDRRRAFGSLPRLIGVSLEAAAELTNEDMLRVSPDSIKSSLYSEGDYVFNGLALNSDEFKVIMLSPKSLRTRVGARADSAHASSNPIRRQEVKMTAPKHVLEQVLPLQEALAAKASKEVAELEAFSKFMRSPGYAHYKEADLRTQATSVLTGSFANLLRVAGEQQAWTPEQVKRARPALETRLFTGPQRQRIGQWWQYTDIATRYGQARLAMFTQRAHATTSEINKINKQLAEFYEANGLQPN